jgi:hypothetical protein
LKLSWRAAASAALDRLAARTDHLSARLRELLGDQAPKGAVAAQDDDFRLGHLQALQSVRGIMKIDADTRVRARTSAFARDLCNDVVAKVLDRSSLFVCLPMSLTIVLVGNAVRVS